MCVCGMHVYVCGFGDISFAVDTRSLLPWQHFKPSKPVHVQVVWYFLISSGLLYSCCSVVLLK